MPKFKVSKVDIKSSNRISLIGKNFNENLVSIKNKSEQSYQKGKSACEYASNKVEEYGSSQLNTLVDSTNQMSKDWGVNRLVDTVGLEKALEIIVELENNNVQFNLIEQITANGNYVVTLLEVK